MSSSVCMISSWQWHRCNLTVTVHVCRNIAFVQMWDCFAGLGLFLSFDKESSKLCVDIPLNHTDCKVLRSGATFYQCSVKRSVNPEIVKNIARCNLLIITVMYIKVYISGMEMSQRIHFWYQIYQLCWFFEKMAKKNTFLVKKILWQDKKK